MTQPASRFLALDVFRGMTICFMIIVNTPGSGATPFAPLEHAAWHGFTPTDLVFPSFLFAVGNAMSFAMKRNSQLSDGAYFSRVLKRTFLIFILGYLMYWFPFFGTDGNGHFGLTPISQTRIMGVLQRIALCYFFAATMIRYLSVRKMIVISALLLIGYWLLLLFFGNGDDPYSMSGNTGDLIDKYLLGESHMYHGEGKAFEPEGLLGTLPAIVNVVVGYLAGKFIQEKGKNFETISKLFLAGSLLILLALTWNSAFPINKKLWSSSFVLVTTGIDLCLIGALIYLVELRVWNPLNWTKFFTIFGKNPLFIYLLSELLIVVFFRVSIHPDENLYGWVNAVLYQVIAPGAVGSLLFAVSYMMICWLVGWWLDKRNIYIRV